MVGKCLVGSGIIEIGQHDILPDHQPQPVAEPEEISTFIGHGAADADHVHASICGHAQPGRIILGGAGQAGYVGIGPDGTPAEDFHAIDEDREILAIRVPVDPDTAKAGKTKRMRPSIQRQANIMQHRLAMGARPPGSDGGKTKLACDMAVGIGFEVERLARACHGYGCHSACQPERDVKQAGAVFLKIGVQREIGYSACARADQADWPIRPDRMNVRTPARHMAKGGCAHQPQALVAHHLRAPAGSWPASFQMRP